MERKGLEFEMADMIMEFNHQLAALAAAKIKVCEPGLLSNHTYLPGRTYTDICCCLVAMREQGLCVCVCVCMRACMCVCVCTGLVCMRMRAVWLLTSTHAHKQ